MQLQSLHSVSRIVAAFASVLALTVGCVTASTAATLSLTDIRATTLGNEEGAAVDTATGRFYAVPGYSFGTGANTLYEYANAAAFEANTPLRSVSMPDPLGWGGTYFSARMGELFDGTTNTVVPSLLDVRRIETSGAATAEVERQPVVGQSTTSQFSWGGNTYANVMNAGSYLSVLGSAPSSVGGWLINRFDYDLNPLGVSAPFTVLGPGFGFQIGDYIFLASSPSSGQISQRVHAITGVSEAVDFFLDSPGVSYYVNNAFYDPLGDTLFLSNNGRFEKLASASSAFGVPITAAVPEPSTYALMLAGLGFVGFVAHRRRKTQDC